MTENTKIKRIKFYVISDEKYIDNVTVEEYFEFFLAYNGIRGLGFTSNNLNKVRDDQNSLDFETKNNIINALIKSCELVIVTGKSITPEMKREIEMAQNNNKVIYLLPKIKAEEKNNYSTGPNILIDICKSIME